MQRSLAIVLALSATATLMLLLLAHQVDGAQNEAPTGIPKTFDFAAYVEKYGKGYSELETMNRAKLFYARTLGIFKTNLLYKKRKIDYYLNQNEYTDLSPEEMRRILGDRESDLRPVEEAKLWPDIPADQFVSDEHGSPAIFEPMTKSSIDDLIEAKKTESPMNFFSLSSEQESLDPKKLLEEVYQNRELAEKVSQVIEIKGTHDEDQLAKERLANNVIFKPYVEPTNKNYDPSLIQTQSWVHDTERSTNRFANSLMGELTSDFSLLAPYPMPISSSDLSSNDNDEKDARAPTGPKGKGYLSSFMDSIYELKDQFLDRDFFFDRDYPNDEEELIDLEIDEEEPKAAESKKEGIVYDVDWRKTGCISAVKSQAHCNSCATFASLDLLEFLYCRQMKTSTEFSVQYVIDCGKETGLRGCQGGKLSSVGMFIKKNGLQLNSVYPYQAREQQCPYDGETDKEKSYMLKPELTGWRLFPQISAWYKWIPKSPIIVGINMPADFLGYSGGIHDGANCVPDMVHAMLLVGSGKQDGKPFWLLKNSFADTWGEAGYFRLSKKAPVKCFNSAVVALAKFQKQHEGATALRHSQATSNHVPTTGHHHAPTTSRHNSHTIDEYSLHFAPF